MAIAHPQKDDDYLDVVIIGAGISGIDAAYHLGRHRPNTRFAILESKPAIGGTWHTHRFPGIRSDSDLFTFGFSWKPWTGVPIATAEEILRYLNEAIDENDIRDKIRFDSQVVAAEWSSETDTWTLTITQGPHAEPAKLRCGFLWACAGYFDQASGFTPDWPGMDRFQGQIVHPQNWPEDLDHIGKDILIIGSGATAATLVPAMAETARSVTMLQRSPTYYYPRPMMDEFSATLTALKLPDEWYHEIMRRKFLHESAETVRRSRDEPDTLAAELIDAARAYLGADYDIGTHFTPSYRPWRQRIAMLPDGDMFKAIRDGKAEVVTDQIDSFAADGLRLASGRMLMADIIVTATGLTLNVWGDISMTVDGAPVVASDCLTHRGIMFTGLPNFATVFGYLRSSWTLRADLVSHYICRVLDHMDAQGARAVVPKLPASDSGMTHRPWIDPENFNAGYILRGLDRLPKQGDRQPWLLTQDYFQDRIDLPGADLDDGTLVYLNHSELARGTA